MKCLSVCLAWLCLFPLAAGHGNITEELQRRSLFARTQTTNLLHCRGKLEQQGNLLQRRAETHANLQKRAYRRKLRRRGLPGPRDPLTPEPSHDRNDRLEKRDKPLKTSHYYPSVKADSSPFYMFKAREDKACVLHPEAELGPFWIQGEMDREDLRDEQRGIDTTYFLQVVDTDTCVSVAGVWVEIWHANALGTYSGIVSDANGNKPELGSTNFYRGARRSDDYGISKFVSHFPGQYEGRATHIHVVTRPTSPKSLQRFDNGTISGTVASHVGQLFFDQPLVDAVARVEPYSQNKRDRVANADDDFLKQAAATSDPMMSFSLVDPADTAAGIVAWMHLGVNMTLVKEMDPAGYLRGVA